MHPRQYLESSPAIPFDYGRLTNAEKGKAEIGKAESVKTKQKLRKQK